ncbi:MAG: MCE family protein [Stackebrandtia sp.]
MSRRAICLKLAAVGAIAATAGCSSAPLPGGEGGDGYTVTAEFADVTDLVPYSSVKVDDVTVGQVSSVEVGEDWTATVTLKVNSDVELPANAQARLRQTSLLGEKFVDLSAPAEEPSAEVLAEGDHIPLDHTDRGAEVEEVLGAMALVLQGGGLEQLKTINTELVDLMEGREDELKTSLDDLDSFVAALDEQRDEIVVALEALENLSADLADQRDSIGEALDALAPGVTTLAEQKDLISDAVVALGDLSEVGSDVIDQSGDDTVAILQDLKPVLEQLVAAGDDFPQGLELAASYPFPHNVTDAISDGFVNLHVTLDADLENILGNVLGEKPVAPDEDEPADDEGASDPPPVTGGLDDLLGNGLLGGEDEDE